MKFEVTRTSMLLGTVDDGKPCEEAILEEEKHRLAHWTVEINNLNELIKFCGKYGETIIKAPQKDDPYPILEIYDDYRE